MTNAAEQAWRLSYEISPIVLVDGVAATLPGRAIPIIYYTEPRGYVNGVSGGATDFGIIGAPNRDLDNTFAHFRPLPGATLLDAQLGTYPFANQAVAANAIITQPLHFSMLMICPVRGAFTDYSAKGALMTALAKTLNQHNLLGGTYNVALPTYIYQNCILVNFADVTGGESKQTQYEWRLDFIQPLLTTSQAAAAQASTMQKFTNGVPVVGDPPSLSGNNTLSVPSSQTAPIVVPAARPLAAASNLQFNATPSNLNPASGFAPTLRAGSGLASEAILALGTTPTTQALQALALGRATNAAATYAASLFPGTSATTTSLLASTAVQLTQRFAGGASTGAAVILGQTALSAVNSLVRSSQATARLASTTNASPVAQAATQATASSALDQARALQASLGTLAS